MLQFALSFLNRLLRDEGWAQQRLQPFAGRRVRLIFAGFSPLVEITSEGLMASCASNVDADVTLRLPPDAPLRAIADRAGLLADIRISGAADLTEALGFVFRNLRWDIEGDLARATGDIAARRIVEGGRQFFETQRQSAENLAANLAEYFSEESPLIARRSDVEDFCRMSQETAVRASQLEKRIAALKG